MMRALASEAAAAAAERVASSVREQMNDGLASLEGNIAGHIEILFARHFGAMDPGRHIEQHSRLEVFLKRVDDMQSGFWKHIGTAVAKVIVAMLIAGAAAYWHLSSGK
jgi:hypothetical protein